jgi:hypothetical protein
MNGLTCDQRLKVDIFQDELETSKPSFHDAASYELHFWFSKI